MRSAKLQLISLDHLDVSKCDWSKIGEPLSPREMVEVVEIMSKDENPAEVEKEYLELIKSRDQLSTLTDLIKELESN